MVFLTERHAITFEMVYKNENGNYFLLATTKNNFEKVFKTRDLLHHWKPFLLGSNNNDTGENWDFRIFMCMPVLGARAGFCFMQILRRRTLANLSSTERETGRICVWLSLGLLREMMKTICLREHVIFNCK